MGQDFAATLCDADRKKYRRYALFSCLGGCVAEVVVDTNVLIILYQKYLGAENSKSMFATAMSGLASVLLLIPFAGITDKIGLKKAAWQSCIWAFAAFAIMGCAPWIFSNSIASSIVLVGLFMYGLTRPLYAAAWFPYMDNFLLPKERAGFFSGMRFFYTLQNAALILFLGQVLVRFEAPVWLLQLTLLLAGALQLVRYYFMAQLPVNPDENKGREKYNVLKALNISIKNSPLVGFSIYRSMLGFAMASVMPLTYIYMKTTLKLPDSLIVYVTVAGMFGSVLGYSLAGWFIRRFGSKCTILVSHLTYVLAPFILLSSIFFSNIYVMLGLFIAGDFVLGIISAIWGVQSSAEMLALARPGNKVMAMAFCGTVPAIGGAVSRIFTSIALGAGFFAATWQWGEVYGTWYHGLIIVFSLLNMLFTILLLVVPAVVPEHEDYYNP